MSDTEKEEVKGIKVPPVIPLCETAESSWVQPAHLPPHCMACPQPHVHKPFYPFPCLLRGVRVHMPLSGRFFLLDHYPFIYLLRMCLRRSCAAIPPLPPLPSGPLPVPLPTARAASCL
jgi:hypothetical protein